jgi:hypothetical protein
MPPRSASIMSSSGVSVRDSQVYAHGATASCAPAGDAGI